MFIATVSSKGQLTLPVEARERLGITAGSRVSLRAEGDQIVIERIPDFMTLKGTLGPARSPAEEDQAVTEAATVRGMARR